MMMTSNTARVSARMLAVAVVAMASLVFAGPVPAGAGADVQGLSSVALAKRSVLCDRTRRGVVTRQHFAPKCPSGWRLASSGPVLCSRISDDVRRTFAKGCPTGWGSVNVDPGSQCVITRRRYSCSNGSGKATTTTVVSTTTTVTPTTTTTVAPTTTTAPPTTTTLPPAASFDARGWEAEILRLTNVERQNAGLGTVASCTRLATAALGHTNRMLAGQFFAHDDPGTGSTVGDRIRNSGYTEGAGAWRGGENIAMGYETAAATMVGWMNSPGHRANILLPDFTHLGVGVSIGVWEAWRGTYSNWNAATMATQNFGTGGTC